MFYSKLLAASLATTAIWAVAPSLALADIIFDDMTASHTDPNENETKPVSSALCDNDWVDCNEDGSVTFTTPNNNEEGDSTENSLYLRSEMRMYASECNGGEMSAGEIGCEFVLDGSSSADEAGGVNATVTSTLSIDRLPSTAASDDEDYRDGVIFSQFHGSIAEPMRAYAVSNGDGSTFDVMIARDYADNVSPHPEGTYFGVSIDLGEAFTFDASIDGDGLLVSVNGNELPIELDDEYTEDDDEYFYAKWGAYASANDAEFGDHSVVTYYDYSIAYD